MKLQPIVFSLKDQVKQQASLSLLDLETGTFKRNSSQSLRDRVMIFRQIDLVDSCFSFFGFEITASTLMAKTSSLSQVPLPREMPADHLNALAHFSIVSDNGHAFEFSRQRAMGWEQLLALKATVRP